MKIKDLAQTAIFICFLIMIPIFGFAYFMYGQMDIKPNEVLDKSFSATMGAFGGVATLVTAYIAACLVVNWKDQTKYNEQLALMAAIVTEARTLYLQIHELRNNQVVGVYLSNITKHILNDNLSTEALMQHTKELSKQFPSPPLLHIFNSRKHLLDLKFNLVLYANNDLALSNIINSLDIIDKIVDIYVAQLKLAYNEHSIIRVRDSDDFLYIWLQKLFNLSYVASLVTEQNFPNIDYKDLTVRELLYDSEIIKLHKDITDYRSDLER